MKIILLSLAEDLDLLNDEMNDNPDSDDHTPAIQQSSTIKLPTKIKLSHKPVKITKQKLLKKHIHHKICSFYFKQEVSTKCSTFTTPLFRRLILLATERCLACFQKHTDNFKCYKENNPCYNCNRIGHHYIVCNK
uniref:CCHC-type domain-containing protein n=1 Tax=Heterorhabditis bacteriophora TaxID=37862 RepID=A0A1I7X7R6_HETBA